MVNSDILNSLFAENCQSEAKEDSPLLIEEELAADVEYPEYSPFYTMYEY